MEQITQEMLRILGMVVMAMLLYLAVRFTAIASQYAAAKLQKKQKEAETAGQTSKAAAFSFALNVLNGVTNTVVSSIEAQKAYQIRQAVKAGEAKASELTNLSTEAYYEIVNMVGANVKEILDDCVDDTEQFIREKIEELLPKVKADYKKTLQTEVINGEVAGNAEQAEG